MFSLVCAKRLNIPVSTGPGPTILTRTPVPASSIAADFVMPSTALLAADIHRRGRAADLAIRRRDVDDAALALPEHRPYLVLHAQKHTEYIGIENVVIALGGNIGSRTGSAHCAGVIDGNIEAAETIDDLVDEVLDFLFMPNVGAHKFGLSAERAKFSG